jgi:hydrogenase-4 membrane subunit HyfE
MELPGAGYFYSLATLSMAFVGFTSIVVVLHQGTGKPLSPLHVLITSLYVELGLMATAFAILAPTLAICGIREIRVWQVSSAIMLAVLVPWLVTYPLRRKVAAPKERLPLRWYIMTTLGSVSLVTLCLNLFGFIIDPGPGPLAITTVYILSYASVAFMGTYSFFLRDN